MSTFHYSIKWPDFHTQEKKIKSISEDHMNEKVRNREKEQIAKKCLMDKNKQICHAIIF